MLKNNFKKYNSFQQHYQFIAPSLNIRYKGLNLRYSPSFDEPDVRYIQPIANNIDTLFLNI